MSVNIECEENGLDYIMKIGCVDSYEIAWNIERGGCGKQKKGKKKAGMIEMKIYQEEVSL
jgi:hypothetical protein